jgi:hypothetical protein
MRGGALIAGLVAVVFVLAWISTKVTGESAWGFGVIVVVIVALYLRSWTGVPLK